MYAVLLEVERIRRFPLVAARPRHRVFRHVCFAFFSVVFALVDEGHAFLVIAFFLERVSQY